MKVSFIAGIGVAMPVILYEIWCFVAPGLYTNEKRYLVPIVFFSTIFFIGGALFGYFVVFPVGFQFFTSFATEHIAPMVSTREFLTFTNRLLFAFGLIFELPIFAFFLAKLGLITSGFLKRQRRVAVVAIFIIAAALTPGPDVFSQLLMAGPLLILYEASIWIAHFFGPKETSKTLEKREEGHTAS